MRTAVDVTSDSPSAGFHELWLTQPILEALSAVGYESPSPIQARTIPALLAGSDVLGQAQTGTGKQLHSLCRCSLASICNALCRRLSCSCRRGAGDPGL